MFYEHLSWKEELKEFLRSELQTIKDEINEKLEEKLSNAIASGIDGPAKKIEEAVRDQLDQLRTERLIERQESNDAMAELSTGRMDPRVGSGRVGPGRVGSRFCRILVGRVGSGQHFGFIIFLLFISWYLNRYESSNTTFGLIAFHRYLIYNNYFINK